MSPAKRHPYSLRVRLWWLFALQTALGLGAVSLSIYFAMSWSLQSHLEGDLTNRVDFVRHVVKEVGGDDDVDALRHKLDDFSIGDQSIQINLTAGDRMLYRSPDGRAAGESYMEFKGEVSWAGKPAQLIVRIDAGATRSLLTTLAWTLVAATVIGSCAISTSGFWLVHYGLSPLRDLASQLDAVSPQELNQRLDPQAYAEELRPWVEQFNSLLERIEAAYRQLEGFNADVAHELRTPLTILITRCELDLQPQRTLAQLQDSAASNLEELHRLAAIIRDMLFLSRADRGAQARREGPSSLAEEVRAVIDFYDAVLSQAGLNAVVVGEATFAFDRGLLRQAVSNLLSNAIRYSPRGSTLEIQLVDDGPCAYVFVQNPGEDIAPEHLSRLFDRFYRVEPSREGSSENQGLGLAIVAAIARMHGGQTTARSGHGITSIGMKLLKSGSGTPVAERA